MPTLSGQRASFTWTVNQYNLAEDDEGRATNAKRMAKIVQRAPLNGFSVDEVTQKQQYPEAEVAKYLGDTPTDFGPDVSESQAIQAVQEAVDTSDTMKVGEGTGAVYAYGYGCALDRLKVGKTTGDLIPRIVAQIGTSTPDRPVLVLEIRTHDCHSLERAIHAVLDYRGSRVIGGGTEWYRTSREEILGIYQAVSP